MHISTSSVIHFYRQKREFFKNKLMKLVTPPPNIVDYIDAPVVKPTLARIPVGEYFLISHNYEPYQSSRFVEEIPLGKVVVDGAHGRIRQRGIWLMEFSWFAGQTYMSPSHRIPVPTESQVRSKTKLDGMFTSTVTFYSKTYGHALLDEFHLLLYLLDTGRFRDFDGIVSSPMAVSLLNRISHPAIAEISLKIISAKPRIDYECTNFVALKRTGCCKNPSLQELELIRKMARVDKKQRLNNEKFYIKRQSRTRTIENEEKIEKMVKSFGFDVIRVAEFTKPWEVFAGANSIIGVAGSDLSDSCFMTKGSRLLEIHPSDHVQPYNWNVAQKLGLDYHGILAESRVERRTPLGPGNSSIYINTDNLDRYLRQIS